MKKNKPAYIKAQDGERRCIVTGNPVPREMLIRFVIGPDNILYPDIKGNLPGRGMWVTAERSKLEEAIKRQRFYKSAERTGFKVPAALPDMVEQLLKEECLHLLGLAKKAGTVCSGFDKIKEKGTDFFYLMEALDGSPKERERLGLKTLPVIKIFTKEELGGALGQNLCVHLALKKSTIAQNLFCRLRRLEAFMEKQQ